VCEQALPAPVTLKAVKADPRFADFALVRVPRLSVMPVTDEQWAALITMARG
jgi:predicted RNA-binding protein with PUA-like domain